MSNLTLEADYRTDMSKSRRNAIRRQGYVTGSVFGHGAESVSVEVKLDDLIHQIKDSDGGLRSLIDMKINGAPKKLDGPVIVKEFTRDPLTRKVLDIQFQRISMKEKIHVAVPIEMVGEAPGIKEGGILELAMDELQISCLPGNIPSRIEVDVSGLDIGHLIRVADLAVGGDVEALTDPDTVVVNCRPPHVAQVKAEEAAEAPAEAAPAESAE